MTECRTVKVEYMFLDEDAERDENLSISIHKGYNFVHGPMIVLEQGEDVIWLPEAFADVIKEWAKGEKA
jgi:hypothetical protein